jgi:hypothetical protein
MDARNVRGRSDFAYIHQPWVSELIGLAGVDDSSSRRSAMPAKSAAQQKAAGAALSAKRGDTPKSKLKGASKSMEKSMSAKQLEVFASTKRRGKPEHAAK